MRENTDRLVCMHDLMKGVVSDEMTELLTDSEVGPEELYRAVLSSNVSLQDKELKLGFVAELADGDDELRAKAGRARKVIRDALAKLGAFPGVVWFRP